MGYIILDIETLQQEPEVFMIRSTAELKPPANYKKEEAIQKWLEDAAASQVQELREKSSLEPLLGGTVCAVGIAVDMQEPKALMATSGDEEGESSLLRLLEAGLSRYPDHVLVTWNGTSFDMEFLRKRAIRHGLYDLARRLYQDKPWSRTHVDLFKVWQGNNRQALGRLRAVASFLGLDSPDSSTGADVSRAWADGDLEAVKLHVIEDIRLTREIYWRFAAAGWVTEAYPEDLPVRPPRVHPRVALMQACAEAMVPLAASEVENAAAAAEISWIDRGEPASSGPDLEGATMDQLGAFLDLLTQGRED